MAQGAQRGGGAPSLHTATVRLDGALSTDGAVGVPAQCREWDQTAFRGLLQLKLFCSAVVFRRTQLLVHPSAFSRPGLT